METGQCLCLTGTTFWHCTWPTGSLFIERGEELKVQQEIALQPEGRGTVNPHSGLLFFLTRYTNTAAYATEHLCVYIKLLFNPSKRHNFPLWPKLYCAQPLLKKSLGFYPFWKPGVRPLKQLLIPMSQEDNPAPAVPCADSHPAQSDFKDFPQGKEPYHCSPPAQSLCYCPADLNLEHCQAFRMED